MADVSRGKRTTVGVWPLVILPPFVLFLLWIALPPVSSSIWPAERNALCKQTDEIGTAMYRYSIDHHGQYPTGKNSTEVFQKLIDEHYVSDPAIFYSFGIANDNKTRATSNTLKPENVCFDITVPVTDDSPNGLPLIFVSGFTISYKKGSSAFAPFYSNGHIGGMAAFYKNDQPLSVLSMFGSNRSKTIYQKAVFEKRGADVVRCIPNFIPLDFKPDGRDYQQLTPDGLLAP
jgi:hypothetical protein